MIDLIGAAFGIFSALFIRKSRLRLAETMNAVFADTFYWVALTGPGDALYEQAAQIESQYASSLIVTTDEVLSEFLPFFSRSNLRTRRRLVETVRALKRNPKIRILPQSRASFEAGFDLYASRLDKGYSLTDCISMRGSRDIAGLVQD